jgi:ABC-type nitrate/sulfonate/bicarbonate transport system permease component
MTTDEQRLLGFPIFALAFVAALTLVVRLAKLRVRARLSYAKGIGLTAVFVGVLLLFWWFLTQGGEGQRIVQPLILPQPRSKFSKLSDLCIWNKAWSAAL